MGGQDGTGGAKRNYRFDCEKGLAFLRETLLRRLPQAGDFLTPVKGFALHRYNNADTSKPHFYAPILVVAVQGRKWVRIGTKNIPYGQHTCFIAGVNMPVSSCVLEAADDKPYLSMSLDLDRTLLADLAAKIPPATECGLEYVAGAAVQEISPELLDAFLRLLELLDDSPDQARMLGELIRQEIHHRLLATPFGHQLRMLHTMGSQSNRTNQAVIWLRDNFKESLHVEELAGKLNMAPSTFHKHFKELTGISPLQYQKRLRLSEAQRLLLVENFDVLQAAFAVGYESANQFHREYRRLYGESPRKHIEQLRALAEQNLQADQ